MSWSDGEWDCRRLASWTSKRGYVDAGILEELLHLLEYLELVGVHLTLWLGLLLRLLILRRRSSLLRRLLLSCWVGHDWIES